MTGMSDTTAPKPHAAWLKIAPDLGEDELADVAAVAREAGVDAIVATNTTLSREGLASPLDHPDYAAVVASVRERFPETPVGPFFLVQAMTDAQRFRSAGIRAYGYSPFPLVVHDTLQIARPNERMQLPAYRVGIDLYRQTIARLVF